MLEARKLGHGRGGVRQTQGSGKSFSMVFFSQSAAQARGELTFVVVTDRVELRTSR
ncbi:MAG: hypothetical protein R3F33_14540 [Planctomycetota bacterium]